MTDGENNPKAERGSAILEKKERENAASSETPPAVLEPAVNSAVKEALDVAQSVGRQKTKLDVDNFGVGGLDDSVSLYEYIDDAERRSKTWFESKAAVERLPIEDLDVLNIAAEFGRPDEISDDSESDYGEMGAGIDGSFEDTKNLKLPSKPAPHIASESNGDSEEIESKKADFKPENESPDFGSGESRPSSHPPEAPVRRDVLDADEHSSLLGDVRRGRLETLRFRQILQGIYQSRFRGICTLRSMGETRNFFVHDGDVLYATSSSQEKDFLSLLEKERYLTKEETVMIRQKENATCSSKIRELLIREGLIRPNAVCRLERLYYERLTLEAFGWSTGDFRLEALESPGDFTVSFIETPMPALIFRGIVEYTSLSDIERFVGDGSMVFKALSDSSVFSSALLLSPEEAAFARALEEGTLLADAAASVSVAFDKALRISAALLVLGFVSAIEPSNRVRTFAAPPKVKEDAVRPQPGEEVLDDGLTLKVKLAAKWKSVEKGTYFDILDLEPCVDMAAIHAAKERLLEFFDRRRFGKAGLPQSEAQLIRIRAAIEEAFLVLSDPTRCESYAAAVLDTKTRHA